MAKQEKVEAAEVVTTEHVTATPETKYPIATLRNNCLRLFDITTSTFDGATHGLSGSYTVKEMNNIIERWKKKEAK